MELNMDTESVIIDFLKSSLHPVTCRTISRKLKINRKVTHALLYHAKKYVDPNITLVERTPHNNKNKRGIWHYQSSFKSV